MNSIAFVTNQPLAVSGAGPLSQLASVRREVVLPVVALRSLGHDASVLSLPGLTKPHLREVMSGARHVVFGRLLPDSTQDRGHAYSADAAAYRNLISELPAELPISFWISDDHFESPAFADLYRSVEARAHSWLVPSFDLRDRIEAFSRRPVVVCPEPAETQLREPRVPRRGLRARLGAALARRARVGLEPWRVRLLWFGEATSVPSLVAVLPELEALAREIPLHLECVSQPVAELTSKASAHGAEFSLPLRISFLAWSPEVMQAALERCGAVLVPGSADEPARRARTNSELIDALHAGRFVIAHPLPSYEELREYAWIGDSLAQGLRWMLRHPDEAFDRVLKGQQYVCENHSMEALAGFWQVALGLRK